MRNLIYDFKLLWPSISTSKHIPQEKTKKRVTNTHKKKKKDVFQSMFEDALSEASGYLGRINCNG